MNFKNSLLTAGLIGVGLVVGQAHVAFAASQATRAAAVTIDDKTLETRIDTAMKMDTTLENQNVDVDVENGIATLTGKVRSNARKTRAGRHANIAGVTRVDNLLTIDASAGKTKMDKAVAATKEVGQDTARGAKVVGGKIEDAASAVAGSVTSAWITTSISSNFVDEALLKDSNINVDTIDHVVTLKGTVMSSAGSDRAEAIARGTTGVTRVVNQLVISAKRTN